MKQLLITTALFLFSLFHSVHSCCASVIPKLDTLANGEIAVYLPSISVAPANAEPQWVPVDTLSPAKLLEELVDAYHNSDYALMGEVNKIKTFRHSMNDSLDGEMDSVYFSIHLTMKGSIWKGFWSVDDYNHSGKVYRKGSDIASSMITMSIYPSPYTKIKNRLALLLTSSLDTIRKTGLEPAGNCTFHNQGYYIRPDFTIEKYYSYGREELTERVKLADFLGAVGITKLFQLNQARSNPNIRTVREGRYIIISVPGFLQTVGFTIANGRGRIVGKLSTDPDGAAKWDSFGIPAGIYYIRALGQYRAAYQRFRL